MQITGNTILVTGATSGIGRALAEALHAEGNTVIVSGRRQQLLDEIVAAHPGIVGMQVDLADSAAVSRFAEEVKERFPKLNVLFNNAGIAGVENYTADAIDTAHAVKIIQTNVTSVIQLTAALLPTLRQQPDATILTTTSGLAFVPLPAGPTYSASKAFLHSWLESLRFQLRNTSVKVLELPPPYVQTELGGEQQKTDPRAMPLDEYTEQVMDLLRAGKAEKGELLVDAVRHLRFAEKEGHYEQALNQLGGMF